MPDGILGDLNEHRIPGLERELDALGCPSSPAASQLTSAVQRTALRPRPMSTKAAPLTAGRFAHARGKRFRPSRSMPTC